MIVLKKRFEIFLEKAPPPHPIPTSPPYHLEAAHKILFQNISYKDACTYPLFGVHARVRALSHTYQ